MRNEKPTDTKMTPEQATHLLFKQSSLRDWQARYKAQKAAQAAEKTATTSNRGPTA